MMDPMREDRDLHQYAKEAFRQMAEGAPHPDITEIGAYLRGELPKDRRRGIDAHLSKCVVCRERMEEFELFLADFERPPAHPDPVIEEDYRRLHRRLRSRKLIQMPSPWLAIAACVALAVGLGYWLVPSTPKLLAEAYSERRSSEFRIAGADWAEFRQQRAGGSAFNLPKTLLTAQGRLAGEDQNDSALLRLRGEAQMIAGDATEAVRTLDHARGLSSNDPRILADLGVSYALRGAAADQFGDYSTALDFLERSLRQQPGNLEVRFNRAVVLEKLTLYPQAETEWKEYLKVDRSSAWAKEARARLQAIEERLKKREKELGQVRDAPDQFLALAEAGNVDAEAWMLSPAAIASRWLARSGTDPTAQRAVRKLAGILAARHADTWLQDMTAGSCSTAESAAAINQLVAAEGQATGGDYASAFAAEERAAQALSRAGCLAGVYRARQLQLTALQNSARSEQCLLAARRLSDELKRHSYPMLQALVARRYGVCALRLGRLDESSEVLQAAIHLCQHPGYTAMALELRTMNLDKTFTSGLPSQVLAGAGEVMHDYWNGSYSSGLLYPVLRESWVRANRAHQPGAALWFARAAVWATSGPDKPRIWPVGAYSDLAETERELGDSDAARSDLEKSDRFAVGLPPQYGVATAVALAGFDLKRGNAAAALARLKPLDKVTAGIPWTQRADYYTTLGEALRQQGQVEDAIATFRKPIESASAYLASIQSENERSGVRTRVEGAYRALVSAQLARPGNETAALRSWEAFRDLDAPPGFHSASSSDNAVLWFLELPSEYVAWFSRAGKVFFHRFEVPRGTVNEVAARFLQRCSDRRSTNPTSTDARDLYRWMVEPFNDRISHEQSLVFELDGALAGVPVQALVSGDGHYLGDRFSVLISTGRGIAQRPLPATGATVLVVANPTIAGASAARFPPLPDSLREAEVIRATFTNSVVLQGRGASVDSLAREIPNVDIIHFAGHGYSDSGYGGLLFAPKDPAVADYQVLRAADMAGMNWSRCTLVVLSACAAAEGETRGDGNRESLIRAITKAGASRVAASSWNIDSAPSADLMAQFYRGLKSGEGPAEALRLAQQAIRRDPRWAHPYYWAGFQLYGTT